MRGWQRSARLVIGLFTLAFGSAVFVSVRDRPAAEESAGVEGLDPDAVLESTGTVVTQTTGVTRDYVVEAERQVSYADGTNRLEVVTITIEREDGRDFIITGREAEVGETETQVVVTGDVRMRASDGLVVTTEHATYDDRTGVLQAPAFVEFSRGRLSGSGVGAIYNEDRDRLRLLDQAHVTLGEGTGGRAEVTSGSASLTRDAHFMEFRRRVRIDQDGQTTTANQAIAYFDAVSGAIEMAELRGEARMTGTSGTPGVIDHMRARDINLTYDESSGLLQHATLAGRASVGITGPTPDADQRIAGGWIDAALAPDGATVTNLSARERVEVDLPGGAERAARRVTAASMEGRGDDVSGLTAAEFDGGVEYRELRSEANTGEDLVTRAARLTTALGGSLSAMAEAHFVGNVRFQDGGEEGTASDALYDLQTGIIRLSRNSPGDARPRVVDSRTSIEADSIDLAVTGSGMQALGNVRSVMTAADATGEGSADTGRMPGLFSSDEPAYVTGGQLAHDPVLGVTTYTGNARLWQGDTAVQANQIELHGSTGDLKALGAARSSFILEQLNEETQLLEEVPTIASGGSMLYEDALRRAAYTLNAHVNGPQGDLTGGRIELYLGDAQRELERVESYEQVKLLLTDRTATGMQLTYFTADGRYVMNGAPVQILEELDAECRETRGKTLTFFRSTDTISVDGNEEVRTQSKTTGTCPAPQFH